MALRPCARAPRSPRPSPPTPMLWIQLVGEEREGRRRGRGRCCSAPCRCRAPSRASPTRRSPSRRRPGSGRSARRASTSVRSKLAIAWPMRVDRDLARRRRPPRRAARTRRAAASFASTAALVGHRHLDRVDDRQHGLRLERGARGRPRTASRRNAAFSTVGALRTPFAPPTPSRDRLAARRSRGADRDRSRRRPCRPSRAAVEVELLAELDLRGGERIVGGHLGRQHVCGEGERDLLRLRTGRAEERGAERDRGRDCRREEPLPHPPRPAGSPALRRPLARQQ